MDDAKRRVAIKQQAAKKKQKGSQPSIGMGLSIPSKRKQSEKSNRLPKKLKITLEPVVGLKAEPKRTVTASSPRKGKGLMKGPVTVG